MTGEGDYRKRRARAHRAYDEWMPLRMDGTADLRDGTRLFRRLTFGKLAEISMLDLRTYRDEQVFTPAPPAPFPTGEVSDPERTIIGKKQLVWLRDSLMRIRPQWKIIGNPVMIAPVNFGALPDDLIQPVNDVTGLVPEDGAPYNTDQWDGYTADRNRVLRHIDDHAIEDVLFVTGDIHSGWACELPLDASDYVYENPARKTAGVEFVCSSVTSNNLKDITGDPSGATSTAVEEGIKANNRHIRYLNFDDHGYSVLDVNAEAGADGLVHHRRPFRPQHRRHLGDLLAHPVGHQPDRARSTTRSEAPGEPAADAGAPSSPPVPVRSSPPPSPRAGTPPRPVAASARTSSWSTAASPTRSTPR